MNIFNRYLPPLMSDYSALHILFFDRPATLILLSPGGCNQPTREVDEYRLLENAKQYTTKLNDAHIAFGIENLISKDILSNIDIDSDFIVILGTSVTNIIGTDLFDISKKIESITKKPVIYFNTSAFEAYSRALSEAYQKMCSFVCDSQSNEKKEINKKEINIIGFNSIIHGHERFLDELISLLEHKDIKVCLDGKNNIKNVQHKLSKKACVSLVLSEEGISLAELLKKEDQIPFERVLPISKKGVCDLYKVIEQYCGITYSPDRQYRSKEKFCIDKNKKIVVIGEPFFSFFLKNSLLVDFEISNITLLSLLEKNQFKNIFSGEIYNQVTFSTEEKKVLDEISAADVIIGDPLLKEVFPQVEEKNFIPLPFMGLSGREFINVHYDYIGKSGFNYLKKELIKTGVIKEDEKI